MIHSVGQRDALKMNKSRAASISDVDGNKPEMRCSFLGLPRRNCPAFARQNCGIPVDPNLHIRDLNLFKLKSSDLKVPQHFLLGQRRTVRTNEHVVIGIDRC